jgi:putative oxidoreductase
VLGPTLQRLFSTFPNSWPGLGLLLLRLCLSAALLYVTIPEVLNPQERDAFSLKTVAAIGGLFLLAGLWTPVMGALVSCDEVLIAFSLVEPNRDGAWFHLFLSIVSASVAMLGPGAWSIDARLFGRQRLDIDRTRGRRSSL